MSNEPLHPRDIPEIERLTQELYDRQARKITKMKLDPVLRRRVPALGLPPALSVIQEGMHIFMQQSNATALGTLMQNIVLSIAKYTNVWDIRDISTKAGKEEEEGMDAEGSQKNEPGGVILPAGLGVCG